MNYYQNDFYISKNLVEGDQIRVTTSGGEADTGVFIRFEDGFLIWVRNNNGNAVLAITSLEGISLDIL